jgi:hypothetical protein
MAVKGKKRYVLYLDEETTEFVKSYLEKKKNKGGLSLLVDKYLSRQVLAIENHEKTSEKLKLNELSIPQAFKLFWKFMKSDRNHIKQYENGDEDHNKKLEKK